MPQQVLAHGGGLDSAGCHHETATGGYHCHNDDEDDVDWSTVGGVVGVLVALWLLSDLWTDDDQQAFSAFSFTPKIGPEGSGFVAGYDLDGFNQLGFGVEPDSTDRSGTVSQLHWKLAF
ncbi:MAG: YHYH domain-containing protein [Chloroflexi bacterium]|nr:YHYH domain-containing protein [Chloroflexota bacterium]